MKPLHIASLFLTLVCAPLQLLFGEELEVIRVKASSQPRLVSSIEYSFTCEISDVGIDKVKMYQKGSKFRAEASFSGRKDAIKPKISAFNGDRYQVLDRIEDGKGFILGLSNSSMLPTSSSTLDPLVLPYAWLFGPGTSCDWAGVKDDFFWKKKFSKARYIGQSKEDDQVFEMVELPGVLPDTLATVYFATDLGYYPLKTINRMKNGDFCTSGRVTRYRMVEVSGEKAVIPLVFEFTQQGQGNAPSRDEMKSSFKGICSIAEDSLKINSPIDDDLFTISPTLAREVIDLDKRAEKLEAMKNHANRGISMPVSRWRWSVVLTTIGLVICLTVFAVRRSRGSRRVS